MPRPGESRPAAAALAISGQRIAVVAVAIAVVLPLLAPSRPTNLIANALHHSSGSGSGGGSGFGAGGVSIDPFAALKGQLKRPKATKLFTVTLNPATERQAFYLRTNVLTNITEKGWVAGNHGATEPVSTTSYPVTPDNQIFVDSESFVATIKIAALGGNAPVFGRPIEVNGLPGDTQWSPQDELLLGPGVHRDDTFQETVTQPNPSPAQLGAAGVAPDAQLAPFLAVPASMPASVRRLTDRLIAGKDGDYDRARAISDYFTNPKNGFTYSLETVRGDSGSDLVDFLTNKTGFCQQYAAAMGILLRLAGVPARVVLGYTHGPADASGQFTVSTDDAHAWVEAYFGGLGWIPFDPTPDAGIFGGAKSNLPWAPRPQAQPGQSTITGSGSATTKPKEARPSGADGASGSFNTNSGSSTLQPLLWTALVLAVLALAGLVPAAVRWRRRRRRLRAARAGDPDPLWAELSDTAIDLGYVWSPARTPRQVVGWLAGQTRTSEGSLQAIATAVEQARYAPPRDGVDRADSTVLLAELRTVEAAMRRRRRRGLRVKARLFPQSLGWRLPRGARRR